MNNRKRIEIAFFIAAAIIFTLISIPLPIPAFAQMGLKLDISVIFIFILFYRHSTKIGLLGLVLAMLFNFIFKPSPFAVGQFTYIAAFLAFYVCYLSRNVFIAIFGVTIIMTLLNWLIITPVWLIAGGDPLPQPYLEMIFNSEYYLFILSVYPAFNLLQWTLNGLIINYIIKRD